MNQKYQVCKKQNQKMYIWLFYFQPLIRSSIRLKIFKWKQFIQEADYKVSIYRIVYSFYQDINLIYQLKAISKANRKKQTFSTKEVHSFYEITRSRQEKHTKDLSQPALLIISFHFKRLKLYELIEQMTQIKQQEDIRDSSIKFKNYTKI
ncbi:hypothetical protein ABPG74_006728 [Tetrahymena malaccensis]